MWFSKIFRYEQPYIAKMSSKQAQRNYLKAYVEIGLLERGKPNTWSDTK